MKFTLALWVDGKPYECDANGAMEALEMALALCRHAAKPQTSDESAYRIMKAIVQLVEGGKENACNLGYGRGIVQLTYRP